MELRKKFEKELQSSLYIHRSLPLHRENSLEAEFAKKKVIDKKNIWRSEKGSYQPTAKGEGSISIEETPEGQVIRLKGRMAADHWPEGAPEDGDYSNFGTAAFSFSFSGENWESYNRLHFRVFPRVATAGVLHLNVGVENQGKIKVPDRYFREGATVFDLRNEEWNDCIWEFPSMGRDKITELTFFSFLSGQTAHWCDLLIYDIKDIRLECVEDPEKEKGWECRENTIVLSSAGYFLEGKKEAVANLKEETFQVRRAEDDGVVLEEKVQTRENEHGCFQVLDFSDFGQEGLFYLQAGDIKSSVFPIAEDICEEAVWKTLHFVYQLRCGMPIAGKHGACHMDSLAEHNGVKIPFSGGWHDAGDLSQQAAQTGEMVHALFQAAVRYRHKEHLYYRLLEEAKWGLDFVLHTRFGDGYRASSAGATRYTEGKIGDFDDIEVRVSDHSYENFLFAGVEAYAAYVLREEEAGLGKAALWAAKEDFAFAQKKFSQTGVDPFHMYEHTYNSGLSQYYAVIVWAAANLYQADHDGYYADQAVEYAGKLIACQEKGGAGLGVDGFFYRDESHKSIVHFNHQSREYQFVQALTLLCKVLPGHPEQALWKDAVQNYAEYQKWMMKNTDPYGMLPAGIYRMDEPDDADLFPYMHIQVDYQTEYAHYKEQLSRGVGLDPLHVLKNFPVWFSFRGNSALLLAGGIAAAQAGELLKDKEMTQIGKEQLYWMWGKNPFGQSLQYGVGNRYCSQYAVCLGECIGEVPVGIETYEDEDVPYWPQNSNATYKEVWIGVACRLLWLMSSIE